MTVNIKHERHAVPVSREVFEALFEHSVVHDRSEIRDALRDGSITYRKLVKMTRIADIPYPLFFAPMDVVAEQLRLKTEKLMAGFSKKSEFGMNSRNEVHLPDVELIVKDLLRKQELLRTDKSLQRNGIVGLLKRPGETVAEDAAKLMGALDLGANELRGTKNKTKALELLISKLEAQHVLVAQSVKKYMPQTMPTKVKFSGMTVKDNKVPYIFIASGDEGEKIEPVGRKVFTLTLLAVLVARNRFVTVNYSGHTKDETPFREYDLAAEILMPAEDFKGTDLSTLEAVGEASDLFKVTPSAVVMRGKRLRMLEPDEANTYLEELQLAYGKADDHPWNQMLAVNALKKYSGLECSRRMLAILDGGGISHGDFCRVMFSNTLRSKQQVNDFRAAVG